jgi:Flp pilus assembly pilin Flp
MQPEHNDQMKEKTSNVMEYALVAMLIAVSIIGGLRTLGTDVDTLFKAPPNGVVAEVQQVQH